jgi:hypothetical protein
LGALCACYRYLGHLAVSSAALLPTTVRPATSFGIPVGPRKYYCDECRRTYRSWLRCCPYCIAALMVANGWTPRHLPAPSEADVERVREEMRKHAEVPLAGEEQLMIGEEP